MPTHWNPCSLFNGTTTTSFALIVLNQPINHNALDAIIDSAFLFVCADGGANRLYGYQTDEPNALGKPVSNGDFTQQLETMKREKRLKSRLPHAIVGDLDSLNENVEQHYHAKGVKIVKDPDQYSTDFTKCLKYIRQWATSRSQQKNKYSHDNTLEDDGTMDVVVLGGLGGRVDQGFSQIHHLFMAGNDPSLLKGRIYLLSEQSLSFVLASSSGSSSTTSNNNSSLNTNIIHLQPGCFAENIGILPILGRTLLTTRGLEWDVESWPTEFGGQVSTSNHIRSDKIEIEFDGPRPLLTLELDRHLTAAGN